MKGLDAIDKAGCHFQVKCLSDLFILVAFAKMKELDAIERAGTAISLIACIVMARA